MLRRLSCVVLVVLLGGGSMVAALCELTCAPPETMADDHAAHHACAQVGSPSSPVLAAAPHVCGHVSGESVAVYQSLHSLAAPTPLDYEAISLPRVDLRPQARSALAFDQRPPGRLTLTSLLRV